MKIPVLGGEGMLGHKMFQTLRARYPDTVCTFARALDELFYRKIELFRRGSVIGRINAMDLPGLGRTLRELRPEYIVNCVGVIKQREEAYRTVERGRWYAILPMLPEVCGDRTGSGCLKKEYSSNDDVLDLEGTRKLLKDRRLMPEDVTGREGELLR